MGNPSFYQWSVLYRKICEVEVIAEKKFTVTQDMSKEKHLREPINY